MLNVQLGHIELFVRDPLASRDFYVNVLGFELIDVQDGRFVWLLAGNLQILLRPAPGQTAPAADDYRDAAAALVLYTDDLDQTAADLRARGLNFRGTDGSDKCLTFTDLDGHWFQLVNPRDH
jgi:catechol 2,3-dioxygenase-like lactoylglutathione lyase family enzyme